MGIPARAGRSVRVRIWTWSGYCSGLCIGSCLGDRVGVEVGFPDIMAGGARRERVETVEDVDLGAREAGAGGCYKGRQRVRW
jgi:hypothetical protein